MLKKALCCTVILMGSAAMGGLADSSDESEPVLRLRFQDPLPAPSMAPKLRPRFDANIATQPAPVPMPRVSLQEAGRVGKFAYVSTAHPNLVIAVGATEDPSELGRQIDRAMVGAAHSTPLFDHGQDSTPFIGLGVRTGAPRTGWSFDATIGAGLFDQAEDSRIYGAALARDRSDFETEARANLRLKYSF
ncbi:MAG: hypothetical protein NXH72_12765 [Hyphomonadaceae bacterium]|nr:hypothetical protein [Hyphomonadaceae bacterium]